MMAQAQVKDRDNVIPIAMAPAKLVNLIFSMMRSIKKLYAEIDELKRSNELMRQLILSPPFNAGTIWDDHRWDLIKQLRKNGKQKESKLLEKQLRTDYGFEPRFLRRDQVIFGEPIVRTGREMCLPFVETDDDG